MKLWNSSVLAAALALAGCNDSGTTAVTDVAATDATSADAQTGIANVPTGNFGSAEGKNFESFSLPNCDESGSYDFYNTDYAAAKLTLVVVAAGWCVPCKNEARQIEETITAAYRDRGLRVIVVYGANPDYRTPTAESCQQWQTTYGLTSHMAYDPQGVTQRYFPNMAYPANLLISQYGQIVYRKYGTSAGLQDLRDAIETNLPQ